MRTFAAIAPFAFFLASSCSWMSDGEVEIFEKGAVLSRAETIYEFKNAILINMGLCAQNRNAGYYAVGSAVGEEVTRTHYERTSVENCVALLIATPCGLNPDANIVVFPSIYRAVIRGCVPRPTGL
ncbi:MAG: hypothetical protein HY042_08440 [Spirochaetia bacterium]|nr:hypothetical protein [Spirochaetia bacterium]